MPEYLIYFNQQWVGDHSEEWFRGRGPLARAVVHEMQAAAAPSSLTGRAPHPTTRPQPQQEKA